MLNKFLIPLEIAVNGVDSRTQEMIDAANKEKHDTIMWACILGGIFVLCIILAFVLPKIKKKTDAKKAQRNEAKAAKKREEELERLHEIKKKNKRK